MVDSDHGVSLDEAADVSRDVSALLDASNALGDVPYTLEVSSPGVDRPLTEPRHWRRARGRLVRVKVTGEGPVEGRVLAADADGVTLGLRRPASAGSPTTTWARAASRWSSAGFRTPSLTTLAIRSLTRCSLTTPGTLELAAMDIDLSVLRSLESEKDISSETALKAIEDALLMAYHKTDGANPAARVEVDRKTGHVTVWAKEAGPDGTLGREYDDTPAGFGRIAATTARQVILQRLRDVEDEMTFGEYAGHEGDIVAGVIQQGKDPRTVLVDLGKIEAVLPLAEQVPGERYVHGERIRCYVWRVRKGHRGPSVTLFAYPPGPGAQAVRAGGTRDRERGGGDRQDRPRGGAPDQDRGAVAPAGRERQGRLHRPGRRPRAERDGRAARREDRHRRLLRRPGGVRRERPVARPGDPGRRG